MAAPNSKAAATSAAASKVWPDLSAYDVRLAVVELPDRRRVYALMGAEKALLELGDVPHRLGFKRAQTGHFLVRDATGAASQLKIGELRAALPKMTMRETLFTEIASAAKGKNSTSRERREVARLMNANPLGINYLGEIIYNGAAGRFTRLVDGSTRVEAEEPKQYGRWLRLPPNADAAVETEWQDRIADGVVLSILDHAARYTGAQFATYVAALYGEEAKRDHALLLQMNEAVEAACIRTLARVDRFCDAFVLAVALYEGMPSQSQRSSVRMQLQQYSTPFPIAVAAQYLVPELAGKVVFEPTVGNGSLLSFVRAQGDSRVIANEIDPTRARQARDLLRGMAAEVMVGDIRLLPEQACDVVVSNPPFGGLDRPIKFTSKHFPGEVDDEAMLIRRLDQLIMLKTLEGRVIDGVGVFVIAGDHPIKTGGEGGRILGSSIHCFNWLRDHYQLHEIVEVDGSLYRKFGAEYPVRIVVVGERRLSAQRQASIDPTLRVLRSFEELRDWTELTRQSFIDARNSRATLLLPTPAPGGMDTPGELEEETISAVGVRAENALQAPYASASKVGESSSMIPRYLVAAQNVAFERLSVAVDGDVDAFVAKKLEYVNNQLAALFSPEQVDALALAIVRLDRGQGFLIGDQTGVGKGRVLAGLVRYAVLNGKQPVFLTEKANLFTDIWRDIQAIDSDRMIVPFLLNGDGVIRDVTTNKSITRANKGHIDRVLALEDGGISAQETLSILGYNVTFATYSQFSMFGSKRSALLPKLAVGQFLFLDESHNASGSDSNLGHCVRQASAVAEGVVYSSATFAKNATNFAVYSHLFKRPFADDYVVAVANLPAIVAKGGESIYESLSTMLVQDGAMIRRENDLTEITFDYVEADDDTREFNETVAVAFGRVVAAMAVYGGDVDRLTAAINKDRKKLYSELPAEVTKGKRLGVSSTNFGSRLYTLQRQLSLLLNARQAAQRGLTAIAEGRKPIFAVEQTMQGLVEDLALGKTLAPDADEIDETQIKPELVANKPFAKPTLRDALARVWTRMQVIRDSGSYGVPVSKSPEQLILESARSPEEVASATERVAALREFQVHVLTLINLVPDLPAYPIDLVREAMQDKGFRMVEVSGRKTELHSSPDDSDECKLSERDDDRLSAVYAFNNGDAEAIMLTRAGMTGLSLHSSETFADRRQREMIEIQIPNNVAERMQLFGRANRRGQVVGPVNTTLGTGLPGDVRLLTMQAKKLASLSATTTSNRENKVSTDEIPDLLNFVGEAVARRYIEDNREIASIVGLELDDFDESKDPTFCVSRLLSRLCLIPDIPKQRSIIEELDSAFAQEVQLFAERGENPFAMVEHDWRATISDAVVFAGAESDRYASEFDRPVFASSIEYEVVKAPLLFDEVATRLEDGLLRFTHTLDAKFVPPTHLVNATVAAWEKLEVFESGEIKQAAAVAVSIVIQLRGLANLLNEKCLLALRESDKHATLEVALNDKQVNAIQLWHKKKLFVDAVVARVSQGAITPGAAFDLFKDRDESDQAVVERMVVLGVKIPSEEHAHKFGRWELRAMPIGGAARDVRTITLQRLFEQSERGLAAVEFALMPRNTLRALTEREVKTCVRTAHRTVLTGNLFNATAMCVDLGYGTAGVFTSAQGERIRAVILPEGFTVKRLLDVPLSVDDSTLIPAMFERSKGQRPNCRILSEATMKTDNSYEITISSGPGGAVFSLTLHGSKWSHLARDGQLCSVIPAHKHGREGEAFAGTRGYLRTEPQQVKLLPDVLLALTRAGGRFYVAAGYRAHYNDLIAQRAARGAGTVRGATFALEELQPA